MRTSLLRRLERLEKMAPPPAPPPPDRFQMLRKEFLESVPLDVLRDRVEAIERGEPCPPELLARYAALWAAFKAKHPELAAFSRA